MLIPILLAAALFGTVVGLVRHRSWLRGCFGGRQELQEDAGLPKDWTIEELGQYTVLVHLGGVDAICGKCGANARVVTDVRSCERCKTPWHYVASTILSDGFLSDGLIDNYEVGFHKPFIGFATGEDGKGITSFSKVVLTNRSFRQMVRSRQASPDFIAVAIFNVALGVIIAYAGLLYVSFIPLTFGLVMTALAYLDLWRDRRYRRLARDGYPLQGRPVICDVAT